MADKYSFLEMSKTAQLNEPEIKALVDHLQHYSSYMNDRQRFAQSGMSLSSYMLSSLIDDGSIGGIEFGRDTLELYSSDLASALRKIEKFVPKQAHPLAPVE